MRGYIERALELAEYMRDEDGLVIARVPGADGFYAQETSVEEAGAELADVIEGNVLLALQLNLPVPALPGVDILDLV